MIEPTYTGKLLYAVDDLIKKIISHQQISYWLFIQVGSPDYSGCMNASHFIDLGQ
ncbi:hypothetical protein KUH03_04125 [Sphingobacterium sp. E70]|uniref:hypothetical protein n=1 Tax=Sphingobacterium sp. E70 TaxID=2853439 RepID=UPI00211C9787|nr:hypothetical protein [Sphingobacterium sp. E70]ULT26133.1 hypothetical protein KUH03_04125 [Sphingobacterium sp. E70]